MTADGKAASPRRPEMLGTLRPATEADMAAVAAIYAPQVLASTSTFEEVPPDAHEMASRWRGVIVRDLPYLVADAGGEVLGFAYAAPYRLRTGYRYTVEDSIYVRGDAAGRGLGRRLLSEVIRICTALGYRQMVAIIGDSANSASIRLHGALGFQAAGVLTSAGFKLGRWVDSVQMQRPLGDGDRTPPVS